MTNFPFYKFSPSGNATVLLEAKQKDKKTIAHYCREALGKEGIGGEQAAFVDLEERSLRMGGGEFCANACRAFGALLDFYTQENERSYRIRVSGLSAPVIVEVEGKRPCWRVSAGFPDPVIKIEKIAENATLVSLAGISHLLLDEGEFPAEEAIRNKANELLALHKMTDSPAAGIVWQRKKGNTLEILPFVKVLESATAMPESACGSASIAVAAMLAETSCKIRQPSGAFLEISRKKNLVWLSGEVTLICAGQIWLNKP